MPVELVVVVVPGGAVYALGLPQSARVRPRVTTVDAKRVVVAVADRDVAVPPAFGPGRPGHLVLAVPDDDTDALGRWRPHPHVAPGTRSAAEAVHAHGCPLPLQPGEQCHRQGGEQLAQGHGARVRAL